MRQPPTISSFYFNHSVFIDWPWRPGYLVVCDLGVYELIYEEWSDTWIERILASL